MAAIQLGRRAVSVSAETSCRRNLLLSIWLLQAVPQNRRSSCRVHTRYRRIAVALISLTRHAIQGPLFFTLRPPTTLRLAGVASRPGAKGPPTEQTRGTGRRSAVQRLSPTGRAAALVLRELNDLYCHASTFRYHQLPATRGCARALTDEGPNPTGNLHSCTRIGERTCPTAPRLQPANNSFDPGI